MLFTKNFSPPSRYFNRRALGVAAVLVKRDSLYQFHKVRYLLLLKPICTFDYLGVPPRTYFSNFSQHRLRCPLFHRSITLVARRYLLEVLNTVIVVYIPSVCISILTRKSAY